MILKKYQIYIASVFIKYILLISLIFLCLAFLLNFLEELKYFENYKVGIKYPILLTVLNSPSILFELFPFIFLISVKFFNIYLNDNNELEIFKNNGIYNSKILFFLSGCSLVCSIFILLIFYTFSSNLKNHYLNLKNNFHQKMNILL